MVGPINRMFDLAHDAGAFTAILTASETPYDARAQATSGERLHTILPRIAAAVLGADGAPDGPGRGASSRGAGGER